jgi:hypothetical protein
VRWTEELRPVSSHDSLNIRLEWKIKNQLQLIDFKHLQFIRFGSKCREWSMYRYTSKLVIYSCTVCVHLYMRANRSRWQRLIDNLFQYTVCSAWGLMLCVHFWSNRIVQQCNRTSHAATSGINSYSLLRASTEVRGKSLSQVSRLFTRPTAIAHAILDLRATIQ